MVRIRSLEVFNIRGVRKLTVDLDGKSIVLLGPNGAGKSSIVDAIDFLLTGEVRRLSGAGAGALSLGQHGRNLMAPPEEAWVEASFSVPDTKGPRLVKVKRTLAAPAKLVCDGKPSPAVQSLCEQVRRSGHHLLSRREILKYILAQPSERHEQVAALMQLDGIEDLRKELQGAGKKAREELKTQSQVVERTKKGLLSCVSPPAKDESEVLACVNEHRAKLGAGPLDQLAADQIRSSLSPPEVAAQHPLQSARTTEILGALRATLTGSDASCASLRSYWQDVLALRADQRVVAAHKAHELLTRGLELSTGAECPLCLREWPVEELRALLLDRVRKSEEGSARVKQLLERQRALRDDLEAMKGDLEGLTKELARGSEPVATSISSAIDYLAAQIDVLAPEPLGADTSMPHEVETLERLLEAVSNAIDQLDQKARAMPRLDGVIKAWDELGAVERVLGELADAELAVSDAGRVAAAASTTEKLFVAVRDEVLDATYAAISTRLQHLYSKIHQYGEAAENDFEASLSPAGAGLNLEVEFYGKGKFPPSALHSEGHQDTLGICLFLALAEHVSGGVLPILVLDDVLMSVDREHRRAVAELLRDEYKDTQLVITTHDEVWARQIRSLGIASKRIDLRTWTLEEGPNAGASKDETLQGVRAALDAGRVESAAHALRRGLEGHLRDICQELGGRVRFKGNGDWGLGDFRDAVKAAFADLLKKALASAKSWSRDTAQLDALKAAYDVARDRVDKEEWAVNPTVHYNEWATMTVKDFAPIVDAYEEFLKFFECTSCKGLLRVVEEGARATALRCGCGLVNWNLELKDRAK